MSRVLIINGVNLGMLGRRKPEVYGSRTLDDIRKNLEAEFPDCTLDFRQTDHEGEAVGWVHSAAPGGEDFDGLIINPGAWTHYAYALHDALEMVEVPKVEVHLSNVHAREEWRRHSVISPAVDAVIAGMGQRGYHAALSYILSAKETK